MLKKARGNKHKKWRFRFAMRRLSQWLVHPEIVKQNYNPKPEEGK